MAAKMCLSHLGFKENPLEELDGLTVRLRRGGYLSFSAPVWQNLYFAHQPGLRFSAIRQGENYHYYVKLDPSVTRAVMVLGRPARPLPLSASEERGFRIIIVPA